MRKKQMFSPSGAENSGARNKAMTIADIAALCNVSKATVSRVLHSPELVREKTRHLVQKALQNSGYSYNAPPEAAGGRCNSMVGLLISGVADSSFGDIINSIQTMAGDRDLLIGDTTYSPYVEARLLQRMVERRAACVVMLGHCIGSEAAIRETEANGVPCLLLWSKPEENDLNYIGFDSALAVGQAADYLVALGHRRIALVVGPYDRVVGAKQRVKGLRNSFAKHGLEVNPSYIVMVDKFTPEAGRLAMTRLLEMSPRPTAMILAGDILAIGAYAAIRQAGLQIPRDISLVTLDDFDFAPHMDPPLTTVHIPTHEMGRLAGQYLAKLLNGESAKYQICLPTSLMLRGSAAEVPKESGAGSAW